MKKPTRRLENKLKKQGYSLVAGVDEAGRGALAGPIVGACVILPDKKFVNNIKDSKLLSPAERSRIYLKIIKNAVCWSVAVVSPSQIDKFGINEANAHVFRKSIKKLNIAPDFVLIDGTKITSVPFPHEYVVGGDSSVMSIAAASIVAKVTRDHIMNVLHSKYPEYGIDSHKGYGTTMHIKAIKTLGPSDIHRKTFKPMSYY